MHADALGHPYRQIFGSLGDLYRSLPRSGGAGMAPWEYTIAKLLSDAGYATALYGKWHLGDTQGRLPTDQGYDEWWGIENSWDEAGYTAWPLFKESGMPVPMIWEGKKGQPSKPVMPLDLKVRPIVDGQYIIPKTIEYIKRVCRRMITDSGRFNSRDFWLLIVDVTRPWSFGGRRVAAGWS